MTQLASDNFTRANENPLSDGGNWTTMSQQPHACQLLSDFVTNVATGATAGSSGSYWNAISFANDQYAQVVMAAMGGTASQADCGPVVRYTPGSTDTWYFGGVLQGAGALGTTQGPFISKVSTTGGGNTESVLAALNLAISANDVMSLNVRGNTFIFRQNGIGILIGVESSFASGTAGIHVWDQNNAGGVVNLGPWAAGNLNAFAGVNASDSFVRANGPLGTNWIQCAKSINVVSNNAQGTFAAGGSPANLAAYCGTNEFLPDQVAQATVTALNGTTDVVGPAVRISGTTTASANASVLCSCYCLVESTTTLFLEKVTQNQSGGATFTVLAQIAITGVAGDVLKLQVKGTSLTSSRNGVVVPSLTLTDSSLIGGNPGMLMYGNVATLGSFSAGSLVHGISGSVGVPFATVSWTGTSSGSVTADGSGNYNTGEVLADGSYTITPSLTGYVFNPVNSNQTVAGADITGVNFTAKSTGGGSGLGFKFKYRF